MKVRVEIEMPAGCKDCPFYYSGELYEWCRYNEYLNGNAMKVSWANREQKPDECPLNGCVRVAECKVTHHHTTIEVPPEEGQRSNDDPFKYWSKMNYKSALRSGIGVVPTEILVRDAVPTRPYLFITQKQYELNPEAWKERIRELHAPESHLIIIPEFRYPKAEKPVQAQEVTPE